LSSNVLDILLQTQNSICHYSFISGILQERILEWIAIPFSRESPAPQIKPMFPVAPAMQADSSPMSHWGSPKAVQPGPTVF